jgi:hypothetical protein
MVGRLRHSAVNFMVLVVITLALPLFSVAAWLWGSEDEKWLMKVLFCVLSPFCASLWAILFAYRTGRRPHQYLAFFLMAGVVGLLLWTGVIR